MQNHRHGQSLYEHLSLQKVKKDFYLMVAKEFEKFVSGKGYWPCGYRLHTVVVKGEVGG